MANHASAIKRHKQSLKRRQRNLAVKTRVRHLIRAVRAAVDSNNPDAARTTLADATRALAKAASKGVYHPNAASRRIARLSRAVHRLSAPAS